MDYYPLKKCLQVLFQRLIPLSHAQNERLSALCLAVLLAGHTHLSKLARQLDHPTQPASRRQWIRRLLDADFLAPAYTYQPFIQALLQSYPAPTLHLLIDRTDLVDHEYDLLCINLSFHGRALPIVWQLLPNAMTSCEQQTALIKRCEPWLPRHRQIVLHGDNEFGGVPLMQYLRQRGWDFILAQAAKNCYRPTPSAPFQALQTLPVTPTQAVYQAQITLTKRHAYTPVNLFAFYHPAYHRNRRKQAIRYYATSLPVTPHLRRIGRRRWGIECYFKDLKSAGWQLPLSHIRCPKRYNSLLIVLNLAYTWVTCLGRWLSKTSQRHVRTDAAHKSLSLFRLGWDWLVHTFRRGQLFPVLTTLYR